MFDDKKFERRLNLDRILNILDAKFYAIHPKLKEVIYSRGEVIHPTR